MYLLLSLILFWRRYPEYTLISRLTMGLGAIAGPIFVLTHTWKSTLVALFISLPAGVTVAYAMIITVALYAHLSWKNAQDDNWLDAFIGLLFLFIGIICGWSYIQYT
jgi:type IV secretory pathway TrbL component